MSYLTTNSIAEQVAAHLREGIQTGQWTGLMPGRERLAKDLGVSPTTITRALDVLEREGLLFPQGAGKKRQIVLQEHEIKERAQRIGLLLDDSNYHTSAVMLEISHQLEKAGHAPFSPDKTLTDLGRTPQRVIRYMQRIDADAWLITSGPRDVLSAIAELDTPAFALFGRHGGLTIAGARPDKAPPFTSLTQRLLGMGHQRISFLCARQMRHPKKAKLLECFLGELEAAGIKTGEYNCPDWEENQKGFIQVLDSLFKATPPTALILDEAYLFHAAYHYVAQLGLKVPQDVSLVCMDDDPSFLWCRLPVTCIKWDYLPIVRRIVRWTNNVAKGKVDNKQTLTKAKFVEGGTIGPARK